jgi:hypothetical protein
MSEESTMSTDVTHAAARDHATLEQAPAGRSNSDPIPAGVAAALFGLWVAGLAWVFAVTPAPDPAVPITALDAVVSLALYGSWGAVAVGLARRQRLGITAGIVAGLMLAGAGLLCLATGHTGMWIAGQIVAGSGLAAASATAGKLI